MGHGTIDIRARRIHHTFPQVGHPHIDHRYDRLTLSHFFALSELGDGHVAVTDAIVHAYSPIVKRHFTALQSQTRYIDSFLSLKG